MNFSQVCIVENIAMATIIRFLLFTCFVSFVSYKIINIALLRIGVLKHSLNVSSSSFIDFIYKTEILPAKCG